jgi:hypothetical protein
MMMATEKGVQGGCTGSGRASARGRKGEAPDLDRRGWQKKKNVGRGRVLFVEEWWEGGYINRSRAVLRRMKSRDTYSINCG